ncbi:glycosyltransferase family 4 protein [Azohydromonas caseinilytica]|uniref:Glycosyltransferase family 4 protein n=1 Tax=Azohydromonas caseinilytica TaxID=2728836 RepID=A0A848F684_9BURK|nr:glycosyltransferase family 4 protein [Azohydromonas caseinilytica]NML15084.1 glycosyltransferase family 4 protein [Azohydromonas caseinilytica]
MKVLLLSKYSRTGASSRLRTLQYLPYLASQGIEVTTQTLFDEAYLANLYASGRRSARHVGNCYVQRLSTLRQAGRYDLLWIEKELFPYFPALAEALLRRSGKKYVVDYDDAIFHHYDLASSRIFRTVLGRKIDNVMRYAACVVAGNDYLAARARAAGARRTEIIPTVVDHTRYRLRPMTPTARPVIGWIGSPSTQKYLLDIREALKTACATQGARLVVVGGTPQIAEELRDINVEVVKWSEDSEADCIARFDVGIMPLRDGPWEQGKCGYKLIQYMACGVPVIASRVGANIDIVEKSQSGLLAGSIPEWSEGFRRLLGSAEERRRLGQLGREAVVSHYSLQSQAPVLAGIFRGLQ